MVVGCTVVRRRGRRDRLRADRLRNRRWLARRIHQGGIDCVGIMQTRKKGCEPGPFDLDSRIFGKRSHGVQLSPRCLLRVELEERCLAVGDPDRPSGGNLVLLSGDRDRGRTSQYGQHVGRELADRTGDCCGERRCLDGPDSLVWRGVEKHVALVQRERAGSSLEGKDRVLPDADEAAVLELQFRTRVAAGLDNLRRLHRIRNDRGTPCRHLPCLDFRHGHLVLDPGDRCGIQRGLCHGHAQAREDEHSAPGKSGGEGVPFHAVSLPGAAVPVKPCALAGSPRN